MVPTKYDFGTKKIAPYVGRVLLCSKQTIMVQVMNSKQRYQMLVEIEWNIILTQLDIDDETVTKFFQTNQKINC